MAEKNIKLSIIMPVYNADNHLEESISSIINQSFEYWELICVDDSSKDNSQKILQSFQKQDKRINIINIKTTKGQSHARNEAMKIAKGEYIGFVDADDFVDEKMFEKMLTAIEEQKADIAMCKTKIYNNQTKNIEPDDGYYSLACFGEKFNKKSFNHHDTIAFWDKINVAVWNKIFRADFLRKIDAQFAEGFIYEDLPFFFQTYTSAKKVVLVKDFLYFYRINSKNSTMTRTDKNVKDRVDMVALTYEILKKQTYFSEIKANIVNWLIHDIFYRCLVIDSRYQKEYFFRMQKFFKTVDTSDIDETMLKSPYYPHFCEIKKRSYEDCIKYFFNQETLGSAYVERAKEVFEKDCQALGVRQQEVLKQEEENLRKKYDLEALQDKILEDEKQRWKDFEEKTEKKQQELNKEKQELNNAWEQFKTDTAKRKAELDKLQDKILQDEKDRWANFNETSDKKKAELQKIEKDLYANAEKRQNDLNNSQQELDNAWKQFKTDTVKRKEDLDKLQDKILLQEKEMWAEYNKRKEDFEAEKQRLKTNNKLALARSKNILTNKFLENSETEKAKLTDDFKQELEKEREQYADILKKQLEIQKNNYEKANELKKKLEETKMTKPKVSIILPVYNVAPYLRQSLDSIIAQTLSDIEIICVDDGSTDESGKILDEYLEKDNRFKVIHKKNAGTGAARNDGLKIATGECIGFVDPDDWILPNMYERLYNLLQEKDLDIVMFTPDVYNDKTKKHEGFLYFQNSNFPDFLDNKIFNKDDISPFSYPMCVWNKLYKKSLFDENNIDFAEGLDFEDHKVIFKSLFTAKRIYFIREKLYVYRHSREGSILSDNDTRMFDHIKIYDIVENILKETGNWEKFHLDFLRYKVHNILYYYTMIKPQYKEEYRIKMEKSLRSTKMSKEEIETLNKDYPELKPIIEGTLVNKIKKAVKKIARKN